MVLSEIFGNKWMIIVSPTEVLLQSGVFVFRLTISDLVPFPLWRRSGDDRTGARLPKVCAYFELLKSILGLLANVTTNSAGFPTFPMEKGTTFPSPEYEIPEALTTPANLAPATCFG